MLQLANEKSRGLLLLAEVRERQAEVRELSAKLSALPAGELHASPSVANWPARPRAGVQAADEARSGAAAGRSGSDRPSTLTRSHSAPANSVALRTRPRRAELIALVEAKVEVSANEKRHQQAHDRCYVGQRHRKIAHLPERDRHRAVWGPIAAAADAERARQIARDRASKAAVRGSGRPSTKGASAKQGQIVEVSRLVQDEMAPMWCLP